MFAIFLPFVPKCELSKNAFDIVAKILARNPEKIKPVKICAKWHYKFFVIVTKHVILNSCGKTYENFTDFANAFPIAPASKHRNMRESSLN